MCNVCNLCHPRVSMNSKQTPTPSNACPKNSKARSHLYTVTPSHANRTPSNAIQSPLPNNTNHSISTPPNPTPLTAIPRLPKMIDCPADNKPHNKQHADEYQHDQ